MTAPPVETQVITSHSASYGRNVKRSSTTCGTAAAASATKEGEAVFHKAALLRLGAARLVLVVRCRKQRTHNAEQEHYLSATAACQAAVVGE